MHWSETQENGLTEWTRSDGYVTVRLREKGVGGYVVRLDVMEQAPEDRTYRRESVADEADAEDLAAAWREELAREE